ncbi:phosphoglycerol transferase MdoB-like AlkP superfamily enzyme [Croceifilum oryzae]|uniref:Phosphoglycerol transferase MdoB-like AlkP superfamily enzyme n=1 Tax=Croceifilum oryzae TaxID=1553429 RepID=A0AAJ1TK39_9BACL|nr:LTA synthase family protein [Croceifilum oryzae]MDQ0416010.1 phosphoglycerol transferase MdoB-like AlkP superfamily enzyme [Croceifilum oryzae]
MKQRLNCLLNYMKSRYSLWILTLLLVVVVELLNRGSFRSLAGWLFDIHDFPSVLLTFLIVYSLLSFLIALIGRAQVAYWIIGAVLVAVAFISGIKWRTIDTPLMPWDVLLASEAFDLTGYVQEVSLYMVLIVLGFIAVSIVLMKKLPHFPKKFSWLERGLFLVLSILLLSMAYTDKPIPIKKMLGISHSSVYPVNNYIRNGFLVSTMLNIDQVFIEEPKGYSEEKIKSLMDRTSKNVKESSKVNPNIIVVLSESLWDPTKMKNVKFSKDPMAFYHSLQKKYSNGEMLSPQFGGWTANVEFEVLTGNTVRFLPSGSVAYNQYVNNGVDSLASILGRQGYTSTAISPTHNWYYQANKVYRNFGFSRYISGEFFEQKKKGPQIADSEVAKKIIETTEKSSGSDFIFANTMENHGAYQNKFKENEKTVTVEGQVSAETKDMLENYATGTAGADEMLKTLVEHYEKSKEPTIVVFFGDHLPALGANYKAYTETNYISGSSDPDFLNKMYRTPLMVWNNYLPEHQDKLDISSAFVGPYVLNLAQKEGTYYTDYLYNLSKRFPVIPPPDSYNKVGMKSEDLTDYRMLQYDILFGKRYGYGKLKDQIASQKYVYGYGEMSIDHVALQGSGTEKSILVTGKTFSGPSKIYLDGKELKTTYQPDGSLVGVVSDEQAKGLGKAKVQVKNVDTKGIDLAVSNVFQMKD